MSNPNGNSSIKLFGNMVCYGTVIDLDAKPIEISNKVRSYDEIEPECDVITTSTFILGKDGDRISSNGDIYEKSRNKIVRTIRKSRIDAESKENEKEQEKQNQKKRA